MIYFIDLFCGAGGVTSGIHRAKYNGEQFAQVIACVNHDPLAIASHEENHPDVLHYTEDIRTLDLTDLRLLVEIKRKQEPGCLIFIWASLECTNFSKAKGGLPRDADSRTLADHMFRYLDELTPDGLWIENVEEFMSWGPLDDLGKPISKRNGEDYIRWINQVQDHNYVYEYRILNAADYGAYTSRRRFFAQFMRPDLPITWPEPTHAKKISNGSLFTSLEKWKAVKDVLDFQDEGQSIFERKKPLSEKTLERIYAGLIKYIAGGKSAFIAKYFSGKPQGKVIPVDGPAGTVTTFSGQAIVRPAFLTKWLGNSPKTGINNGKSIEEPAPVITTQNRIGLVQPAFLAKYYSNGGQLNGIDEPAATLPTKDRISLVIADRSFLMGTNYDNRPTSLSAPSPTITASRKWSYLVNPSWGGHPTGTEQPAPVIIARGDKAPMYLVQTETGQLGIEVFESDSPCMVRIKEFMAAYGIIDIRMRMLKIPELLRIQGFGDGYVLKGTQADQKRFIGNAVEVNQAMVLIEASYRGLIEQRELKIA